MGVACHCAKTALHLFKNFVLSSAIAPVDGWVQKNGSTVIFQNILIYFFSYYFHFFFCCYLVLPFFFNFEERVLELFRAIWQVLVSVPDFL